MMKLWHRIINIGIDSQTDEDEVMYIQVCNGLSILVSIWMLSLVPLVLPQWPDSRVFVINGILFPMLWPLILFMNYKKWYMLARIYLTATSSAIITINVLSAGTQTENHLFIVMYIASAFVTYPKTKHFLMVGAVGLINFGLLEYWFSFHEPFINSSPGYYQLIRLLSIANIPVLFIIMALYHKNLLVRTQRRLKERTQAYQNLLDHAGQGFFTFDYHLTVQPEYSMECRRLFGKDISAIRFTDLFYPGDAAERQLQEEMLGQVFQGDDLQREVCLSLLPAEVELRDRRVAVQYKWIPDTGASSSCVMVVMTDISDKWELERRMVEERQVMRMVIWVVRHYENFKEMMEEYRSFAVKGRHALLAGDIPVMDKWAELFITVHTFKGNFAQIDFVHLPGKLHELESQLADWKHRYQDQPELPAAAMMREWFGKIDLLGWLEDDIKVLREFLGERFDREDKSITIPLSRLRELEQYVLHILPDKEAMELVTALKKLQHRPFRELLGMYPETITRLADKAGKPIHPVEVGGGEMLVNPELYSDFTRSLIHVCRNIIDHGIETPEARALAGKDYRGHIRFEISENDGMIQLKMSNDGAEIDLRAIRTKSVERGICTGDQFDGMSVDDQRMLIVHKGFTTKQSVSQLSGRGMGLSAVLQELVNINGTMRINSSAECTEFVFNLRRLDD